MRDVKLGDMPAGMPVSVLRDLDWKEAVRLVAVDIAEDCGKSVADCDISRRLIEAEDPIRFEDIARHIPSTAPYTDEEVVSLYCTVASLKEGNGDSDSGLIEASDRVEKSGSLDEYRTSMRDFLRIYDEVGENSRRRYDKWMEACRV